MFVIFLHELNEINRAKIIDQANTLLLVYYLSNQSTSITLLD